MEEERMESFMFWDDGSVPGDLESALKRAAATDSRTMFDARIRLLRAILASKDPKALREVEAILTRANPASS